MVVALLFPSFPPNFANPTEILISVVTLSCPVAMLRDFGISSRWDSCSGFAVSNGIVAMLLVVGSVPRHWLNVALNLVQQFRQRFPVSDVIRRDISGENLPGLFVDAKMELALSTELCNSKLNDKHFLNLEPFETIQNVRCEHLHTKNDRAMEFTPCSPFADAMLPRFPLSFSIHFHPS